MATKKATDKSLPSLQEVLAQRSQMVPFEVWCIGATPLITHAWALKSKQDMSMKQTKETQGSRPPKDPVQDFEETLYRFPDGGYGFPAMAVKKAILGVAHKDKGIAKVDVARAFFIQAEMVNVLTAHAQAVCTMPLLRLHGLPPAMREDMVRVGTGLSKKASLAYRAQFEVWALHLTGMVNPLSIPQSALSFLLGEAGRTIGIGDWRHEKTGVFGSWVIATPDEARGWVDFVEGRASAPPGNGRPDHVLV